MKKTGEGEMPGKEPLSGESADTEKKGPRPDLRVVQPEYNSQLGKTIYKDVGAMWKNTSKAGNEFYTMKIGKLKLLVFPNNKE